MDGINIEIANAGCCLGCFGFVFVVLSVLWTIVTVIQTFLVHLSLFKV